MYWTIHRSIVTDLILLDVWAIRLHRYYTINMIHMCTKGQTTGQLTLCTRRYIQPFHFFRCGISCIWTLVPKLIQSQTSALSFGCNSFNPPWVSYGAGQWKNKSFKSESLHMYKFPTQRISICQLTMEALTHCRKVPNALIHDHSMLHNMLPD